MLDYVGDQSLMKDMLKSKEMMLGEVCVMMGLEHQKPMLFAVC